ncbi:hypothetical protein FSP39_020917 [Pinctada imbricata]|uniref:Uncharacterized protein n=1 Tax=Pinctada imbricata TaxID=66713 RepID=A0AA88Y0R0_PINIB|nr:hypothetical protein FSP39_020917 [Pinctada imbricata]
MTIPHLPQWNTPTSDRGAFVYADLGLMIPRSGGDYTYLSRATGNFTAFMYIWVQILVIYPMANVILSMTVGEYLTALFIDDDCGPREIIKRLIAAAVISMFIYTS